MGGAMLRQWLAAGMPPERVTVVSPSRRAMPEGVNVVHEVPRAQDSGAFDVIVLALKPQQLGGLRASPLGDYAPRVLISILAGVEEAPLAALCPARAIVRAMPNLPVAIGKGVVALHSATDDSAARTLATDLMVPLGLVEWIEDEALFDAVTALSGCGPGFVFRFIETLANAGAALGLPADQALRLAQATVAGSSAMAAGSAEAPGTLADRVASPGGSTREGLNVLDTDGALQKLLEATLKASFVRNRAMAASART